MENIYDRTIDLGEYKPEPDDDRIICRCEEVTKGEIRRAVHDGMYTITEIRRYLRSGMGLCQGQTCAKLVKRIGCFPGSADTSHVQSAYETFGDEDFCKGR